MATTAFAAGGDKPSDAPQIVLGQHYFGDLNAEQLQDKCYPPPTDFWKLPPLLPRDVVTVAWSATGTASDNQMFLLENVDDYSWGAALRNQEDENDGYDVSADSGSARTPVVASSGGAADYLAFGYDCIETPGQYDFVVEGIQHALGLALSPAPTLHTNGQLTGSAVLTNGTPAPDGLFYQLTATWKSGQWQTSAQSIGGHIVLALHLPASAVGKRVTFEVTRPADAQYLAAQSVKMTASVTAPAKAPASPVSRVRIGNRTSVHHGRASVRLVCGPLRCAGLLTLRVGRRVLARAHFSRPAGHRLVVVRVGRWGLRRLAHARHHQIRVQAIIWHDHRIVAARTVWLRQR
jgi:hypothetical protein